MDSPIQGVSYSNSSIVSAAITSTQQVGTDNDKKYLENISTKKFTQDIDIMAISENSQKLSNYHKDLKNNDNKAGVEGLKHAVRELAVIPDNPSFNSFMDLTQKLKEDDNKPKETKEVKNEKAQTSTEKNHFQDLFTGIHEMKNKNLNTGKWIDTISSMDDIESQKGFIDTTRKIIDKTDTDSSMQKDVFDNFVKVSNSLAGTREEKEKLDDLYSSVSKQDSLPEMKKAINEFKYNMVNK